MWYIIFKDKKQGYYLDHNYYLKKFQSLPFDKKLKTNESISKLDPAIIRYYCYIKVIKDAQNPQFEGQIMIFKFGFKIWQKITEIQQQSKNNIINNVFQLNVSYTNYDSSRFLNNEISLFDQNLNINNDINFPTYNNLQYERKEKLEKLNMKIYTKTGDDGSTGLYGSNKLRVKKYDLRVETYGTIDELNSSIGLIYANILDVDSFIIKGLTQVQRKLFNISSQLAMDNSNISRDKKQELTIKDDDIIFLESSIDFMTNVLPELKDFILPSGHIAAVYAHMSRTICRRAERKMVKLAEIEQLDVSKMQIDKNILIYINRLSDFLFTLARYINNIKEVPENKWRE